MKVTDHRTARDFADCMREVADVHYPDADRIRVVMDNLSTHTAGALYQAFPAPEAHRVLQRLEFHYTPKHASWLNMVEIEIACCAGNVWIAESVRVSSLSPRSRRGSGNATPPAPASNGSSPRKRRGTSWHALILTPPKSHNHCAEVLVVASQNTSGAAVTLPLADRLILIQAVAQRQDHTAFVKLFDYFAPRVKALMIRSEVDPPIADEIAQETMATVWRDAAAFDPRKKRLLVGFSALLVICGPMWFTASVLSRQFALLITP